MAVLEWICMSKDSCCGAEAKLRPVMNELAYNLESFNPAFTAVLLKVGSDKILGALSAAHCQSGVAIVCPAQVQSSIGFTDYVRRDMALKNLIQPLAGEYGMHNGEQQGDLQDLIIS